MRKIRLLEIRRECGLVYFRIIEQTHRGLEFSERGRNYYASNGLCLSSHLFPEPGGLSSFCCRGDDSSRDDLICNCEGNVYERIREAIAEYNRERYIPHCQFCGKAVRGTRSIKGAPVCAECRKALVSCECCDRIAVRSETTIINNKVICSKCLRDYYRKCVECGKYHERYEIYHGDGFSLCRGCFDASAAYSLCDHCGRVMHSEDANYIERRNLTLCEGCYGSYEEQIIENYSYKPTPIFHSLKSGCEYVSNTNSPKKLFLGVENECDNGDVCSVEGKLAEYDPSKVYFKRDGSLSGSGIEIVSHPCTLEYHYQLFGWKELFGDMIESSYLSHDAGNCGLHVHVNNSYFSDTIAGVELAQLKLLLLINRFWPEFVKISRRKEFGYCEKNGSVKTTQDVKNEKNKGRYYAINLENRNTTEFRLWRGTLNENTFFATLEITSRLCQFVKENNALKVRNVTWNELKNYLTNKSKYAKAYIAERNV